MRTMGYEVQQIFMQERSVLLLAPETSHNSRALSKYFLSDNYTFIYLWGWLYDMLLPSPSGKPLRICQWEILAKVGNWFRFQCSASIIVRLFCRSLYVRHCHITSLNIHLNIIFVFNKAIEFNSLRPRQNGRLFPDDILKCIFLGDNVRISIKKLKFIPRCTINNIPALV